MNDVKKSIVSAGIVALGIAAVIGGVAKRNAIDLGLGEDGARMSLSGLVASADKDVQVPEAAYFDQLVDLLKNEYVDPIPDESKLVDGAVRGMILSLEDSNSTFMSKEELSAFLAAQKGEYEGVGVVLQYEFSSVKKGPMTTMIERIPRLVVSEVAAGGPASKAGVKVGDQVVGVDGHWVVNAEDVMAFRKLSDDVEKKLVPAEKLLKAREEMRVKSEHSIMPGKAIDKLMLGTEGSVKAEWRRAGKSVVTTLTRSKSKVDGRLRFGSDATKQMVELLSAGPALDLRQNSIGDFGKMLDCLNQIAPKGTYGTLKPASGGKSEPLAVTKGTSKATMLQIKVDEGTQGAAEVFALALQAKGLAKLEGKTGGKPIATRVVKLPSGAGYTLATGVYSAGGSK